jgi:hypothetical protein
MPRDFREQPMRMLFGMVLGALLTVGAAFFHDTWNAGASANTAPSAEQRPMVNWDVVDENWRVVRQRAREAWTTLSHKVTG